MKFNKLCLSLLVFFAINLTSLYSQWELLPSCPGDYCIPKANVLASLPNKFVTAGVAVEFGNEDDGGYINLFNEFEDTFAIQENSINLKDLGYYFVDFIAHVGGGFENLGIIVIGKSKVEDDIQRTIISKFNYFFELVWTNDLITHPLTSSKSVMRIVDNGDIVFLYNEVIASKRHIHLVRITENGEIISDTMLPSEGFEDQNSMIQSSDGNLLIAGQLNPGTLLKKVTPEGVLLWHKVIVTHPDNSIANQIFINKQNEIVLLRRLIGGPTFEFAITKLDQEGNLISNTLLPEEFTRINDGFCDANGDIIMTGAIKLIDGRERILVTKYNANDVEIWRRIFHEDDDSPRDFNGVSIIPHMKEGYILSGFVDFQSYVARINNDGLLTSEHYLQNKTSYFNIKPNPVYNNLNIEVSFESKIDAIKIFDMNGQIQISINKNLSLANAIDLNVMALNPGLYLMTIQSGGTIKTGKFIKMQN